MSKGTLIMYEQLALYFPQSSETISLKEKGTIVAGRGKKESTLLLTQKKYFSEGHTKCISRKHFKINQKGGYFFIEDLDSKGGTEVNGNRLQPGIGVVLHLGDKIRLAQDDNFLIEVIDDDDEDSVTVYPPRERPKPPKPPERPKQGIFFEKQNEVFFVDGQPIHYLSQTQESLLTYLYKNIERTSSYGELREHVWFGIVERNTINKMTNQLRQILNKVSPAAGERYIKTIRGYGYKLTQK